MNDQALRGALKRTEKEVERLQHQMQLMKAERDRRLNLKWNLDVVDMLDRLYGLLGELDHRADPRDSIPLTAEVSGGGGGSPIPGANTASDRVRLGRFLKKLNRTISEMELELENEAAGRKQIRVPRPRCRVCGRSGQAGFITCPHGCGPYNKEKQVEAE